MSAIIVNSAIIEQVKSVVASSNIIRKKEELLAGACIHNDIWMKCKPVCPKICSDYLYKNRCSPKKCEAGCACPDGWLRKGSDMGYCIPKHKCERWIIN
nr:SCO-spondin [Drosophila bipectinata]